MAVKISTLLQAIGFPALAGLVQFQGSGATTITQAGNVITVSSTGGGGGSSVFSVVEANLGTKPVPNGTFDITGLTGLVTSKPVFVMQASGPYTGKGTLSDEIEMDHIVATGYVLNSTTIRVNWGCATRVAGNVKFNYLVSA